MENIAIYVWGLLLAATLAEGGIPVSIINGEVTLDGNKMGKGVFKVDTFQENDKTYIKVECYTIDNPDLKIEKTFLAKNQNIGQTHMDINSYTSSMSSYSYGGTSNMPVNFTMPPFPDFTANIAPIIIPPIPTIEFPKGFPFNKGGLKIKFPDVFPFKNVFNLE